MRCGPHRATRSNLLKNGITERLEIFVTEETNRKYFFNLLFVMQTNTQVLHLDG